MIEARDSGMQFLKTLHSYRQQRIARTGAKHGNSLAEIV